MRHGRYPFIIGFLAAPVAIYSTFVVAAYVQAFQLSFTNWRGFSADVQYIGFENFVKLWNDDVFWKAIRHHGLLLVFLPLITIVLALFFSFLLHLFKTGIVIGKFVEMSKRDLASEDRIVASHVR